MRIIVIGAVDAGTNAAAKAIRNDKTAEIIVFEQDQDISYAICGIPYYLGGEVSNIELLNPRTPQWFKENYNIDIKTLHRVEKINRYNKTVEVTNLQRGIKITEHYDKLIIATGASPYTPDIFLPFIKYENLFQVRTIQNAIKIHNYISSAKPKHTVIVGAGMIGIEMAEQLKKRDIDVTIIQKKEQVITQMDKDMASLVETELEKNNIKIFLDTDIINIESESKNKITSLTINSGEKINADMVILAAGVTPNTAFIKDAGIKLGTAGAVKVDNQMRTSDPDIYAVGDASETFSIVTGKSVYRPLASTANKMGRIAGDVITGGDIVHRGVLGTGIVRVFNLTAAFTGLTESEAGSEGYDYAIYRDTKQTIPGYMGSSKIDAKIIADKRTGRLLGAQLAGDIGVDKYIDIFATAISLRAKAEDLFHLDLSYSPPYSNPRNIVHYAGMVLADAVKKSKNSF